MRQLRHPRTELYDSGMEIGRFELCLKVSDLATSRKFYETLGFKVSKGAEADGFLILKSGSASIGLYQGHIGENLLNFRGGDVFAIAQSLEESGLQLESPAEIESDGSAGAMVRDPDGNLIYFNTSEADSCR